MKRSLTLLGVTPLLLLAACAASENGVNPLRPSNPALQGGGTARSAPVLTGSWQMVSLQKSGQARQPAPAGVPLTAEFASDGNLFLQADCNRCRAGYAVGTDGSLEIGPMACTRAYCSSAPLDTDFAGLLSSARQAEVSEHSLSVTSEAGSVLLQR
jgi:heat shock protein HslJ